MITFLNYITSNILSKKDKSSLGFAACLSKNSQLSIINSQQNKLSTK